MNLVLGWVHFYPFSCFTTLNLKALITKKNEIERQKIREEESNLRVTTPLVTEYGKHAHMQ